MTACALWSPIVYQPTSGDTATFSADRLTATQTAGNPSVFGPTAVTSGNYVYAIQFNTSGGYSGVGLLDFVTVASNNNAIIWQPGNDAIVSITAGTQTQVCTGLPSTSDGAWVMVCISMTAPNSDLCWFTIDGTNYYGSSGPLTAAQVEAGVGGAAMSQISAAVPFGTFYHGTGDFVLNSGATSYPFSPPTGFGNLPATPLVAVFGVVATVGVDPVAYWTSSVALSGGLEYSLNGGAWTACSGGVAGTSGQAIMTGAGASLSAGAATVALRPTGSSYNPSTTVTFFAFAEALAGAGNLLDSISGDFSIGPAGSYSNSTTFTAQSEVLFQYAVECLSSSPSGVLHVIVGQAESPNAQYYATLFVNEEQSSGDSGTPDSGPSNVYVGTTSIMSGTLTANTAPCSGPASITNNGEAVAFNNYGYSGTADTFDIFDSISIGLNGITSNAEFKYVVNVFVPAPPPPTSGSNQVTVMCVT